MPWYYAGPEAKPIGPVTLEELHARRANGTVTPETYVIEHTGQSNEPNSWKRYQDLFPSNPSLPPPPPVFSPPAMPPPPSPTAQPHLLPSPGARPPVFSSPAGPDPYYSGRKNNPWCQWGFWLGLLSLPLLLVCGLGTLVALAALFPCLIGLVQVSHRPAESGRGMALSGLFFSVLALFITTIFLAWAIPKVIKEREQTVTEQSSSDSE